MAFSIQRLAKELCAGTAKVRGNDVSIRALRASESDRVRSAYPRPYPTKMMRPTNMGSLAPDVPNEHDPDFRRSIEDWMWDVQCAEVVIGADVAVADGTCWSNHPAGLDDAAWLRSAVPLLREHLSRFEIVTLWNAILELCNTADKRVCTDLISQLPDEPTADDIDAVFKLPRRYGVTNAGMFLRVCERYGIDPFKATATPDYEDPGLWSILLGQEQVRNAEEAVERAAAVGATS